MKPLAGTIHLIVKDRSSYGANLQYIATDPLRLQRNTRVIQRILAALAAKGR